MQTKNGPKERAREESVAGYLVVGLGFELSEDGVLVGEAIGSHRRRGEEGLRSMCVPPNWREGERERERERAERRGDGGGLI